MDWGKFRQSNNVEDYRGSGGGYAEERQERDEREKGGVDGSADSDRFVVHEIPSLANSFLKLATT